MVQLSIILNLDENFDIITLNRCIQSLTQYRGKDVEILILAGSEDENKKEIFNPIKNKDKRIHVIYNQEEGISEQVLSLVRGYYITIMDSCDYIDSEEHSRVMGLIRKIDHDIVLLSYSVLTPENIQKRIKPVFEDQCEFTGVKDQMLIEKLLMPNNLHLFKSILIKTQFIKENELLVNGGLEENLNLFDHSTSMLFENIPLFIYQIKPVLNDSSFSYDAFNNFKDYLQSQIKYINKWEAAEQTLKHIYEYAFTIMCQLFFEALKNSSGDNETFEKLKQIMKSDWVRDIVVNLDQSDLNPEFKKLFAAFKMSNVRMVWILYKFNKEIT